MRTWQTLVNKLRGLTRSREAIALLYITLVVVALDITLPARHLPWRALDLNDSVGLATGLKLRALGYTPRRWCASVVRNARLLHAELLPVHNSSGSCGWSHAYSMRRSSGVNLTGIPPYPMNCPLLAAAHIWLRDVKQLAAGQLGSPLVRVHHAGTYSCRRMYGRKTGPYSEHAYANAWDVTGFELADGRVVSIRKHWAGNDPAAQFLEAARNSGCRFFGVVLSPDHNAAHHDHFHLDMGPIASCD